ncbi:methyltransferase domain-containing protein [Rhabdaerophilum sp.]|uniref:methyltransferase domain-containing protein n=1 Tax=Rhabdaerophilum sp. TaxID=2717341 RepID=UPI0038D4B9B2
MFLRILPLLCDPETGDPLTVEITEQEGEDIIEGVLISPSGHRYPIRNRIPRFVEPEIFESVKSFGNQWNHFNFVDFKQNWLDHTVANTFGGTEAFRDKVIVDCGGGSGAQSLWMLEAGAREVIMLELSHSVDDVVARNITTGDWPNFTVIQCSIDHPPIRSNAIDGIVICHNVIQHTESVERTARPVRHRGAGWRVRFQLLSRGQTGLVHFHQEPRDLRPASSRLPECVIRDNSRLFPLDGRGAPCSRPRKAREQAAAIADGQGAAPARRKLARSPAADLSPDRAEHFRHVRLAFIPKYPSAEGRLVFEPGL